MVDDQMPQNKKKRILLVGDSNEDFDLKFYEWLKSMMSKEFIVKNWYIHSNSSKNSFFLIKWYTAIKKLKRLLKKFNPNKIMICGDSLATTWIIVFIVKLFRLKIEISLFRYDMTHFRLWPKSFREKYGHFVSLHLEKFCLLNADKIIHTSIERELELLPFYKKIQNKPHHLFREYINPKLVQKYNSNIKLSKKDREPHLVYVGTFPTKDLPNVDSIWNFIPKITSQSIHFHLYSKASENIIVKYKSIEKKDLYFHYEGYIKHDKLTKELTKYDYGLRLHVWNRTGGKIDNYLKTQIGNKDFDYISASLPIICHKNAEAVAELVRKNGIGICINSEEALNLKKILMKNGKKMPTFIKNIDIFIKSNLDSKKLIDFIKN